MFRIGIAWGLLLAAYGFYAGLKQADLTDIIA
jgi:hypothetical protein